MSRQVNVFNEENITKKKGKIEVECGTVSDKDLLMIVDLAKKLNMKCLNFVSNEQDTIFNEYQAAEIKNEVAILENYSEIDLSTLRIIRKAAIETSNGMYLYLKFYRY